MDASRRFAPWVLAAVLVLILSALVQAQHGLAPLAPAARAGHGDLALYREVIRRVGEGERYHQAAAAAHRARGYPLKPFYAVRPPTLAWIAAAVPAAALLTAAWALLAAALLAWGHRLRDHPPAERLGALLLLAGTGAPLISAAGVLMHEVWCGLLLTVALAVEGKRRWLVRLALVALAALVREFAAAFLALLLAGAISAGERRRTVILVLVAAGLAGLFGWHGQMVEAVVTPSDARSPGWLGLMGPVAMPRALTEFSWIGAMPAGLAAVLAFLPLLGWCALERERWLAPAWFIGFAAVIAVFARPDNGYWILVLLPACPMGLALVPGFLRRLGRPGASGAPLLAPAAPRGTR